MRYARTSDGVTLAYQVFGHGPPVVWLPSLSNLLAQWQIPAMRRAYEDLARSMTVVLYDGRGTGASDRRVDLDDLGIEAHLRDLDAVLTAADLDSTSLLGYYHSVATAIAFAAAHPARVTRMVLFGGAARMRDAMGPAQTQALLSLVAQDWDLFADSAAQAWLGWGSGETGRLTAAAFRTAAAPATAQAWFTAAASIDVSDVVSQVAAPTLVLHRQGERQISVEVSRRLAEALPHGRLIVLPGAFPALFLEDARADLELVTGFLTTGQTPAPGTPVAHVGLLGADPPGPPGPPGAGITGRELDVLRLLAAGESNAEIARQLGISVHTVERHVSNLYRKIGARGRADATAFALRRGVT